MFCPKCGTENPETGKFCRSCGTDLGNISDALAGKSSGKMKGFGMIEPIQPICFTNQAAQRRQDPNEVFGDAMKSIILGIGFLVVAIVLFLTDVANGQKWWWAMLFPAFGLLAKGIPDYLKSKRMEKQQIGFSGETQNTLNQPPINAALPPTTTKYVAPESRYQTGDLVPSSVTDGTTRHLEINKEGETMALPKK